MKVGFIGLGHMAGSILHALSQNQNHDFYVNDHHEDRLLSLKEKLGDRFVVSNYKEILDVCPLIFLGVKPKDMSKLLCEVKDYVNSKIIVSMAAGYSTKEMMEILGNVKIIRIMPNTPVAVRSGVTFATYRNINPIEKQEFVNMMSETGSIYEISEDKMDTVSVLTGSTPAYLDYFLDALIEFGKSKGFTEEESKEYVLKMAKGTIDLNLSSTKSPLELGKEVCSPGGSTIEGVNLLEKNGFRDLIKDAAEASYQKNKKMK